MTTGPYGDPTPGWSSADNPAPPPAGYDAAGYVPDAYDATAQAYPQQPFPGAQPDQPYPGQRYPPAAAPYPATAYPPPGYGTLPVGYGNYVQPRNGLGTAALVLGIIGVVLCWIPFTGWALNILAIIFGAVGRKRAVDGQATNKSSAVAGLVLGVVGLGVWIIFLIVFVSAVSTVGTTISGLSYP